MELFNFLPSLPTWITGVTGFGVLSWVLLAIFAPSVLNVISSWLVALSPLVKTAAEALAGLLKHIWEGFKDVVDNVSTIIFVVIAVAVGSWYFHNPKADVKQIQKEYLQHLQKNYTLVPKNKGRR
jgi:hypothetical protein